MSYNITLYGHGPDPDDVREVFENAVRALRAITPADMSSSGPAGSCTDGAPDHKQYAASEVTDAEAADTGEDEA